MTQSASQPLGLLSDEALMGRVATGDSAAFAVLVERHAARQMGFAARVLGSVEAAEDAVQEAFAGIWVKAARFDPVKAKFSTWLYRVVMNRCLDAKRKRSWQGLDSIAEPEDPAKTPERRVEEQSVAHAVKAALEELPERQKIALSLCYFDELTNREAAEVMGLGIKALESLLTRARGNLKTRLEPMKTHLLDG